MKETSDNQKKNVHIKDVPEDVLARFKAWCSLKGTTMKKALTDYMTEKANEVQLTGEKNHE